MVLLLMHKHARERLPFHQNLRVCHKESTARPERDGRRGNGKVTATTNSTTGGGSRSWPRAGGPGTPASHTRRQKHHGQGSRSWPRAGGLGTPTSHTRRQVRQERGQRAAAKPGPRPRNLSKGPHPRVKPRVSRAHRQPDLRR